MYHYILRISSPLKPQPLYHVRAFLLGLMSKNTEKKLNPAYTCGLPVKVLTMPVSDSVLNSRIEFCS